MLKIEKAISVAELPGAVFFGELALAEHRDTAAEYEKAVSDFERDGDACALWHVLAGLGFDAREIAHHIAHRGERMPQGYAMA